MTCRTITCTYHCSVCGLHLHAMNAFETHRTGDYASNDPELGRHCLHPIDLDGKLVELTTVGECRMYEQPGTGVGVKRGVTVWTLAENQHRTEQRFGAGRPGEAEGPISGRGERLP